MVRTLRPRIGLILALCAAGTLLIADAPDARAHGGRIRPKPTPGGGLPEPPPTPDPVPPAPGLPTTPPPPPVIPGITPTAPTDPTPPATPPATPATPPPSRGRPEVTGQRGRRSPPTAPPETRWDTWWELNRWSFLPDRAEAEAGIGRVVTPAGGSAPARPDAAELTARRRELVTRQQILPFLLRTLDPAQRARDEVRSAALLALAKTGSGAPARTLILRYAFDPTASALVRESAALALGLLRRADAGAQASGEDLDGLRERLLSLVGDGEASERTRSFAALSLGLLADQPYGSPFTKGGRRVARGLWMHLRGRHRGRDLPAALLTSLGMQPAGATGSEVRQSLQRIVTGRRILGRSWNAEERSHALAALVTQAAAGGPMLLSRTLSERRTDTAVRRAALIALGARAATLPAAGRLSGVEAVLTGMRHGRDPLTRGLGFVALGRLLGADLGEGSRLLLERSTAGTRLLGAARNAAHGERGFAALGLALAARRARETEEGRAFGGNAAGVLLEQFERTVDDGLRGAFAVGLGLVGERGERALAALTATLADRRASAPLRGHVALALAQIGARSPGVLRALRTAMLERRSVALRSEVALALSFLGGQADGRMLLQELRKARSQWVLAQIAAALGQLGDVSAVPEVIAIADDARREDETRALAIAALGLLGDPHPRPSLLRLTRESNYPAATDALWEAFTIL